MHVLSLTEQERSIRSAFRDAEEGETRSFLRSFSGWLVTLLSGLVALHHLASFTQLFFLWDLFLSLC
jgi:hypothetical protein